MKKKSVISLIKYYTEKNDVGFRSEAYEIAKDFDASGDYQLAEYIMSLLSNANTFVPQVSENVSPFFEKIEANTDMLLLPDEITGDLIGIVNAIEHHIGINKFLFQGAPGTGKTEAVKQLARILNREIFMVDFSSVIDSKLGQTQKNLSMLFKEINQFAQPDKVIVLFDEIDALALDRTNQNDLREMGRATSTMLKEFDRMNEDVVLIATTNLYQYFDDCLSLVRATQCWELIKEHLIDSEGEWFWSLRADGTVNKTDDKAGFWKCPYHNGRMCMEVIERFHE